MRTRRALVALVLAVVAAPWLGVTGAPAELPVTIPGDAEAETGAASLTDVRISTSGAFDEVVFTFAGEALPTVDAVSATPPFYATSGETVTVPGSSFVRVRMFPARGVAFGEACASALPAPPTPGPGEVLVGAWFSCFDGLNGPAPVVYSSRAVPDGTDVAVLEAALDELLAGPLASDTAAGLTSLFSPATAGLLSSVVVAPDGAATIDFDPTLATTIPNASSSAGSDELLRELDATVFQLTGITSATYTLGGSCADFFAWLQMGCTTRTPADGAAAQYAITYTGPDVVTGPSANVTEAAMLEDFEAQIVWVIGLRSATDVTVTTATSPARVIVRVAHAQEPTTQPRFTG